MADNETQQENGDVEIKIEEPTLQCYIEEQHKDRFSDFENANAIPSNVDITLNLWTSKATTCLIDQYKKYRSMVGQSTQIRSLREMFEMISLEMQKYGFYFSPQKCENKWRVLERKYKNLVYRERLKKPGRMRHYGQWEHKRALDEIFNEKKKYVYLERNDLQPASGSAKYPLVLLKRGFDQGNNLSVNQQHEDSLAAKATTNEKSEETLDCKRILTTLFEKFAERMEKNFAMAEKNKETAQGKNGRETSRIGVEEATSQVERTENGIAKMPNNCCRAKFTFEYEMTCIISCVENYVFKF